MCETVLDPGALGTSPSPSRAFEEGPDTAFFGAEADEATVGFGDDEATLGLAGASEEAETRVAVEVVQESTAPEWTPKSGPRPRLASDLVDWDETRLDQPPPAKLGAPIMAAGEFDDEAPTSLFAEAPPDPSGGVRIEARLASEDEAMEPTPAPSVQPWPMEPDPDRFRPRPPRPVVEDPLPERTPAPPELSAPPERFVPPRLPSAFFGPSEASMVEGTPLPRLPSDAFAAGKEPSHSEAPARLPTGFLTPLSAADAYEASGLLIHPRGQGKARKVAEVAPAEPPAEAPPVPTVAPAPKKPSLGPPRKRTKEVDPIMGRRAADLAEQALEDLEAGRWGAARRNLKLAIAFDPGEPRYADLLAGVKEEDAPAEPATDRAHELYEAALLAEQSGDYPEAVRKLELAIKSNPRAAYHNHLGVMLATRFKNYERAQQLLEMAVELEPHASYEKNLAAVLSKAATGPRRETTRVGWLRRIFRWALGV